jgi:hypothetical protein
MDGTFPVNSRSATSGWLGIGQGVVVSRNESDLDPGLGLQVANTVHGDVPGVMVQAAVIHGGVHVGAVHTATAASAMALAVPAPDPHAASAELFGGRQEQIRGPGGPALRRAATVHRPAYVAILAGPCCRRSPW